MNKRQKIVSKLSVTTISLLMISALFIYLDPDASGKYAGILVSIVTAIVSIYFGLAEEDTNPVESTRDEVSTQGKYLNIDTIKNVQYIPAFISFILLISSLLLVLNIFSYSFQVMIDNFRLPDNISMVLKLTNAGYIFFSSVLPLSAICSINIGYRSIPVYWSQSFMSTLFTLGCIAILTIVEGIATGLPPIKAILGALFVNNIAPTLTNNGTFLMAFFSLATSLTLVLGMTTWLWIWAKFGHWRFSRKYKKITL
jgi:hypothetical protein